jgi:N utilization substance protein B
MPSRHRSRQRALQILFNWDARSQPVDEAIRAYYENLYSEENEAQPALDPFTDQLVKGVVDRVKDLDERITRHTEHWRIERMPGVDRNIIRLALFEMLQVGTPPAVAIDEALELARRYSGEESVHFINGVLDAAWREHTNQPKPV